MSWSVFLPAWVLAILLGIAGIVAVRTRWARRHERRRRKGLTASGELREAAKDACLACKHCGKPVPSDWGTWTLRMNREFTRAYILCPTCVGIQKLMDGVQQQTKGE